MSCLVFLVLMVLRMAHDDSVKMGSAPTRVSIDRERGRGAGRFSSLSSVPADESVIAEPASVEPLSSIKSGSEPRVSTQVAAIPTALIFQKTRIVSTSQTARSANWVSIRDIQPSFVKSPVYLLEKGPVKTFTPRTWLRVVVTFDLSEPRVRELTFRYQIYMGNETFVGALNHSDIVGAGEHQTAAFLVPSAVEPVIQRGDFEAKKSVAVEVTAMSGETELARASFGSRAVLPGQERSGFLRSVEDTPFAPLEIDLYELREN